MLSDSERVPSRRGSRSNSHQDDAMTDAKPESHSRSRSNDYPAHRSAVPDQRSRSPAPRRRERSASRGRHQRGCDVIKIADEDASFILGAGGRTKRKLSRVCGAALNIKEQDGHTILEIRGNEEARERAKLYVDFVMQQRVGPVRLKFPPESRTDLTCIEVRLYFLCRVKLCHCSRFPMNVLVM